jgi:crotonobetaine/carnitine-CoA ligase
MPGTLDIVYRSVETLRERTEAGMTLPEEWKSWRVVPDRLRYWADNDAGRPFLQCAKDVDDASWLSYGEVHARTDALAGALAELGIDKLDRVAIVMPNRLEYLLSFFALAKLGAIQVPINPYLKGEFLRHQLADSGAKALIGDEMAIGHATALAAELADLSIVIQVGETAGAEDGAPLAFDELIAGDRIPPNVLMDKSDLIAVMYTSGTTGMSKGCKLTHGYYQAMPWPWFQNDWLRPGDRTLTAMPLFHIGGQGIALMPALLAGNSIAFLEQFSARGFIDSARNTQATIGFGVGPMGMAILATEERDSDRAHALRLGVFVPMPIAAQDRMAERFGIGVVTETYGQTECQPITGSPIDRPLAKRASLGRPVAALEVQLHDDRGRQVPVGDVGEIVLRPRESEVMYQGYWNNDAATVAASGGMWHHTGDLARADEDGYLYFADRKKDAIRRRGENISSVEVETALLSNPKITAVAVHAVPSPLGEDDVKAVIVCAAGQSFEPRELHDFFCCSLPYFAVPRYVDFADSLPLTPTGRVQKHLLRARDNSAAWDLETMGFTIKRDARR